jgi:hypothetical protein
MSKHVQPNSGILKTTMRCSGGSKCNCTQFNGRHPTKRCKTCHHGRGSHYEPNDNDSSSGKHSSFSDSTGDVEDSNDNSNDNNSNDDNGNGNDNGKLASTRTKNKMTVSSLVADLLNGEHSKAEVEDAKSEARAGLTRQQVGSIHKNTQQ